VIHDILASSAKTMGALLSTRVLILSTWFAPPYLDGGGAADRLTGAGTHALFSSTSALFRTVIVEFK
jgi:hypothetical protein